MTIPNSKIEEIKEKMHKDLATEKEISKTEITKSIEKLEENADIEQIKLEKWKIGRRKFP